MPPSDRPIFVVGSPRSGTTLFRVMLHAHPRIALPPETQYVMPAYHRRARFKDLDKPENRQKLADWITQRHDSGFHYTQLDPDEVGREIVDGPPTLGSALGIVFRAYARKFGKERWGDKRPAYYGFMEELDRMFPDAQFIHVIRDGRAVVASYKAKMAEPRSDDGIRGIATWIRAIDAARKSGAKLGPERYYEVRYEDFIADAEREMRAVCAFLEEDFHPDMCQPELIATEVTPKSWSHQQQILQGIHTKSKDAWRDQLEPWEVATMERVAGGRLTSLGYELSGIGGRAPIKPVAQVVKQHLDYRRELAARRRRDRRALALSDRPVAALLTRGQLEAAATPQPVEAGARLQREVYRVRRALRWRVRKAGSRLLPTRSSRDQQPSGHSDHSGHSGARR
jgi:hypothetical protein